MLLHPRSINVTPLVRERGTDYYKSFFRPVLTDPPSLSSPILFHPRLRNTKGLTGSGAAEIITQITGKLTAKCAVLLPGMETGGYGNFNNIFIAPRLVAGQKAWPRLRCEIVADNAPRWLRSRHFANLLLAAEFVPGCKPSIANLCNFYAPMRDTRVLMFTISTNSPPLSTAPLSLRFNREFIVLSSFLSFLSLFPLKSIFSLFLSSKFPPVVTIPCIVGRCWQKNVVAGEISFLSMFG